MCPPAVRSSESLTPARHEQSRRDTEAFGLCAHARADRGSQSAASCCPYFGHLGVIYVANVSAHATQGRSYGSQKNQKQGWCRCEQSLGDGIICRNVCGEEAICSTNPSQFEAQFATSHPLIMILCGDAGTRLWPASREVHPKQLLPLFGTRSMFRETLLRVSDAARFEPPVVSPMPRVASWRWNN